MRQLRVIVILAVFSLVTGNVFGQTLGAVLTGSQEVPATTTPGYGNSTVTFDATRANITVTITVANLGSPINNFHIHEAPPGVSGPVVVNLIGLGGTFSNGTLTGTFPIAADVAARMLQNPGNFYVNVHTVQFPGGAVRGNLAFAGGNTVTYAAELRPGNEVPAATSNAFGSALVTFDTVNNTITWEADGSGIANATLSHIHRGVAGVNGPVIINFATSAGQIPGGRTSGSAAISSIQAGAFLPTDLPALFNPATASGYYVNIHSTAFPGGEIRGQLAPANEFDVAVAGHIANAAGQTYVTDARIFNPSYTAPATALIEYLPAGTSLNTTASAAMVVNVPARGTAVLDDVAGSSGLNVSGNLGALRVSNATGLAVSSRVFNDLRSSSKGTLGGFVPAASRAGALRRGVVPHLANTGTTTGYRTNVGFFNPNPSYVAVRLELRDSAGTLVGQSTISLSPLSQQQNPIGSYFTGVDVSNAANLTLSFDASAPVFGYGAVNDNVSGTASFVAAQSDSGLSANQTLPQGKD
jgi:hypothetical protein